MGYAKMPNSAHSLGQTHLDYGLLQSSSDVIAAGGYCRRFIMRPDVCPSTDSKRRPYRFEIFSFQNYIYPISMALC